MSSPFASRILFGVLSLVPVVGHSELVPIIETFSNAGPVVGSTPDSGSGTWNVISGSSGLSVADGTLSIAGASGQSAQLDFSSGDLNAGEIYLGFDFTVSSSSTLNTSGSISAIAGFRTGTAGTGTYALGFGDFRPTGAAQDFSGLPNTSTSQVIVGIFSGSSLNATSSTPAAWETALDRGVTYRAVIGFDLTNDSARLWIDPLATHSTSVEFLGLTADVRGVFVREGAASHGPVTLDNLYVSNDFATAAGTTAVPEPSTYALICGSAVLAGVTLWKRGRRISPPTCPSSGIIDPAA
jgi:hypothetical protein